MPGNSFVFDLCRSLHWRMAGKVAVMEMDSVVGPLLLGAQGDALCFLEFLDEQQREQQLARLSQTFAADIQPGENAVLALARQQLTEYFAGTRKDFDLTVDPAGTPFQRGVWCALQTIPYGTTTNYGEIANRIGKPTASRAVGAANGRNPISIVIPCHRVVGASGDLTGYAGGVARKDALLRLEAAGAGEFRLTPG